MGGRLNNWVYKINPDNSCRFLLGEKGQNIIGCIGINPSTASPNTLDNTLKSVKRIARFNGFDGWIMFNVYPQRATNPSQLHHVPQEKLIGENLQIFQNAIEQFGIQNIWLAYGNLIEIRKYLPSCLHQLLHSIGHLDINWKISGLPTQKGHPRHPLYTSAKSPLVSFDLETCLQQVP
nr:DUF1643 domain-containing protein [uncultured Allomuricauda sp.]